MRKNREFNGNRLIDSICRTLTLAAIFMVILTAGTCDYYVEIGKYFDDSLIIVPCVVAGVNVVVSFLLDSYRSEVIKWVEMLLKM